MLALDKIFGVGPIQRLNKMIAGNNAFSLFPGQSGHVVVVESHKGDFYLLKIHRCSWPFLAPWVVSLSTGFITRIVYSFHVVVSL
jgi:hypothetical protein